MQEAPSQPSSFEASVESVRAAVHARRNWVLIAIALGVLLNPLNSSMISVAVARLQHVFQLTFADASWIISTYYLSSAIAQPVMGKVADRVGRKRMFLIGLTMTAAACILAPMAPTFGWLIGFRLIQSVGSSALFPSGMAIVRQWITQRQASALAFLSVFSSGAAAFGPSIGGILIHWGDWPMIFFVNFPFIIASFLMAVWLLPSDQLDPITHPRLAAAGTVHPRPAAAGTVHPQPAAAGSAHPRLAAAGSGRQPGSGPRAGAGESVRELVVELAKVLDLPGIAAFAAGVVFLLWFLLSVVRQPLWWTGPLSVLLLGLFVWRELHTKRPFVDLRVFRTNLAFTWVEIQFVTVNIIFYAIFFGIPEYFQEARHFSSQLTGLVMLCLAGSSVLVTPLTGRWVERQGSRPPLLLAGFSLTAGSLLVLTWGQHTSLWWTGIVLFVLGLSNGLNNIGLQTALFASVPSTVIGTASGLFMTARYFGTILSTVLLGFVFRAVIDLSQVRHLAIVLAVLGLAVIVMSLRVPKGRHETRTD